jgi:hypothetical protein
MGVRAVIVGVLVTAAAGGAGLVITGGGGGTTCSSVTQYGITWTFNKAVPCGTFANGDSWVSPASGDSTVTVTAMSPTFASNQNGAMVNPVCSKDPLCKQGFDDRLDAWDSTKNITLPYVASPGASIVKTDAYTGSTCGLPVTPCLDTAAVLTVESTAADRTGEFRPPYAGTSKPVYTTAQLQTGLLPSLASVTGAPTLAVEARRYQRVQLDFSNAYTGRYMHPINNFGYQDNTPEPNSDLGYGAQIGVDASDAALRLSLSDSVASKMSLITYFVQAGIDYYGLVTGGNVDFAWNGSGHIQGRKTPLVYAAALLNDSAMKTAVANDGAASNPKFGGEDSQTYYSSTTGGGTLALWGRYTGSDGCGVGDYDFTLSSGSSGTADCQDPDEYIDGGVNNASNGYGFYQTCCTSGPYKGQALAVMLLSGGRTVWNHDAFFSYTHRWVTSGYHMLPDDRTPRYASLDGTHADDGGSYQSTFTNNMWTTYAGTVTWP